MVYENMSDGVVIAEVNGRILYANPAMLLVLGMSTEDLAGCHWTDVFPEGFKPAESSASSTSVIFDIVRPDGRKRTLIAKSFDLTGEPPLRVSILRDVTRRREAQARLMESEERFRTIVEALPLPVVICQAREQRILFANDRAAVYFVTSPGELEGRMAPHLFYEAGTHNHLLDNIGRHGTVRDIEVQIRKDRGQLAWAHVSGQQIRYAGEPALLLSFLDITERRRSEEKLRLNERRYRTAIAQADAVLYMFDVTAQKYLFLDSGIERLCGYTPDQFTPALRDSILLESIPRGDAAGMSHAAAIQEAKSQRLRWKADYRIRAKDGTERWLSDSSVPIEDEEIGSHLAYIGILQDVTERRNTEQALHESQERLHQVQKLEALGRLAGVISHDFSNLLTAIIGNCQLGLEQLDDPAVLRNSLEEIAETADRSGRLIRQLLDFCREVPSSREIIDLNDVTSGMTRLIQRLIGETVTLEFSASASPLPVDAARSPLDQVVMNLAVNARDAMPQGGTLRITAERKEVLTAFDTSTGPLGAGDYAVLAVTDTGHGISPEIAAKIFDPFFTTKGPGAGTGLGLSAVYGIVRRFHGGVQVQSRPGQGTTFSVYLPLVSGDEASRRRASTPHAAVRHTSAGRTARSILLVEDDAGVRTPTALFLRRRGYDVTEAGCAEEALQLLRNQRSTIDLIITDLVMPGMSGLQFLGLVREFSPAARSILMSGYASDLAPLDLSNLDLSAVIEKPFSPRNLLASIRECLGEPEAEPH
ncbi:MAG: hypothetical protein PWP23_1765 [Candidatus Sumerlaeota bacterium]|nr:hypothetical protein [Candidatus Sumerlaeota bacterium]